MTDPVYALLHRLQRDLESLPGVVLEPTSAAAGGRVAERLEEALGRKPPRGLVALYQMWDGVKLGDGLRLLDLETAAARCRELVRGNGLKGLWPFLERGGRLIALDAEAAWDADGEWPVVEIFDRTVDRVGTTLLRFLSVLATELRMASAPPGEVLALYEERSVRDPGFAEHWVDLADVQERYGKAQVAQRTLELGMRAATPPGPSLLVAIAIRDLCAGDRRGGRAAVEDALALEPLTARDDDARLDAAALLLTLARRAEDKAAEERARGLLGNAAAATAAFWRGEAVRALAAEDASRLELATDLVRVLVPDDLDVERLRLENGGPGAARSLLKAREALDDGDFEGAARAARAALAERPEWGLAHATLAEALNASRGRGAIEAASRATELNPELVEGWRELGDAYLEARDASRAEAAFRQGLARDDTYGLLYGKRAQALLELGRKSDALRAVESALELGGDTFFLAAVKGDVLSAMERHREAAEAYDQALKIEPDNHWALHQAAIEHGAAGNHERAIDLFELALVHDGDGCHQTLVDYADLMRKLGRIGDAVRLYRRAVAAVPNDPEWRQWLREAERELEAAPN